MIILSIAYTFGLKPSLSSCELLQLESAINKMLVMHMSADTVIII